MQLGTARCQAATSWNTRYWAHDFFQLRLWKDGSPLPYRTNAQPHRLDLLADGAIASVVFRDSESLLFRVEGATLQLLPTKPWGWTQQWRPGEWLFFDSLAQAHLHARARANGIIAAPAAPPQPAGSITQSLLRTPPNAEASSRAIHFTPRSGAAGELLLRVTDFQTPDFGVDTSFAAAEASARATAEAWDQLLPPVLESHRETTLQAWRLLRSLQVEPKGRLTRPALLMSKASMNQVWSWDYGFNALAVARADPELAWNQLRLFVDHSGPNGEWPDAINDAQVRYGFVKPPIHGWFIDRLLDRLGTDNAPDLAREFYEPLVRATEWWFIFRDSDGDGVCEYLHGNDSGWDNSTVFDAGYPCESPDLTAFLYTQMECLARLADWLGEGSAAVQWRRRADAQLAALLDHGWQDGELVAKLSGSPTPIPAQSLLTCMPMILGRRLTKPVWNRLLERTAPGGPLLTEWGLASEPPSSPRYEPDGYWRGPIWAPVNYLVFRGLAQAGENERAADLAQRCLRLFSLDRSFAENYDALSGRSLRCPGYSWTAAVAVLMAEWLAERET